MTKKQNEKKIEVNLSNQYFIPKKTNDYKYIIIDNNGIKNVVFVARINLFKNISMFTEKQLNNYFESLSNLLGNNANMSFTTILGRKDSSAVDVINVVTGLLKQATEQKNKTKKVILLSQIDLILKKIGEKKSYGYIVFSDFYNPIREDGIDYNDVYFNQKINPFLKKLEETHYIERLEGVSIIQFINEINTISRDDLIYINEKTVSTSIQKKEALL